MGKRLTNSEFIEKAKNVHGNKYDYSLVVYIDSDTKIKIICPIHGAFEQIPYSHYNGYGCSKCTGKYLDNKFFIERAKQIHGNNYDYSLVNYKSSKSKIKLICYIHGMFEQKPNDHLNNKGCPKCGNKYKSTTKEFIIKANNIHKNKYDYSLVDYKNSKEKINIICLIHGIFKQRPNDHLKNVGCPICKQSKGESKINQFLKNNNISYKTQKTFNSCNDKRKLRFDFYIPKYNTCIEYDGIQHHSFVKYFGGYEKFQSQQKKDKIKEDYCKYNNINLIRIKYNENIEDKLKIFKQ